LQLPEGDGRQACRELQESEKTKKIPILFVTGCRNPSDIAEGLSLGADDYITKPFNPLELRARCEARLRKVVIQQENENFAKAGPITLNLLTRKAYTTGTTGNLKQNISLTPSEFQLLHYLIMNADKTVTRQEILESLSLTEHVTPGSRIVDAQIKALRKKSEVLTDRIKSIYGKGYQYSSNDPGVTGS
jgi:DNA-binding response OmpR family regulator